MKKQHLIDALRVQNDQLAARYNHRNFPFETTKEVQQLTELSVKIERFERLISV
ncbi:hypothetical protein [Desertibacillus haloalkaliphilus]|uniref:hypothetical protein n=1 Tax=Desertibacillus haloalkaliphilus TaxID=1328930 RepID=UPI001C25B3C6|nr:hypothetical protein [Desertibacillus haloalkaliphilus]MBU8905185.1 hypothetical protein [Desertibacillus haloalkaliphilus]